MKEIWKAIPGFEGAYEASNTGNIRSIDRKIWRADERRNGGGCFHLMKGKQLKPSIDTSKTSRYSQVMISFTHKAGQTMKRQYRTVHRLVWSAFNGPIPANSEINHKDKNRFNNAEENLECLTKQQHQKITNKDRMGGDTEWLEAVKGKSSKAMNILLKQYYDAGYAQALEDVKKLQIS